MPAKTKYARPSKFAGSQFEGELLKQANLNGATFVILDARPVESEYGLSYLCQIESASTHEKATTFLNGVAVIRVIDAWLKDLHRVPMLVTLAKIQQENGRDLWLLRDVEDEGTDAVPSGEPEIPF